MTCMGTCRLLVLPTTASLSAALAQESGNERAAMAPGVRSYKWGKFFMTRLPNSMGELRTLERSLIVLTEISLPSMMFRTDVTKYIYIELGNVISHHISCFTGFSAIRAFYSWHTINSLRPSDAIWRHRSGSALAQVMAWHQAITWTNVDLSSVWSSGSHLRAIA